MALQTLSLDSGAYENYTLHEDQEALVENNRDLMNLRVRYIRSLKIVNFKSFQGSHYVGPFTEFTAVIGPNGGGKSNVLDAIAFALGLTTRDLRCAAPDELIYSKQQYYGATAKKTQQEDPDEAAASVEITFSCNTPEVVRIRRKLNLNGQSTAYVNDQFFSEEAFGQFLLQSKVHVASKNFMLLQGETDQLATVAPQTLTELFEKMSGSVQYKKDCQVLDKKLDVLRVKINELSHQKALLRTEQKKLKSLMQTSAQYRKLQSDINELRSQVKLLELYKIDEELKESNNKLNDIQSQNYEEDKRNAIIQLQQCEGQLRKHKQSQSQVQDKIKQHERQISEIILQKEQNQSNERYKIKQIETLEKSLQQLKSELQNHQRMIEEIDLDIKQKQQQLQDINAQGSIEIPKKHLDEYEKLLQEFKNNNFQLESEIKKLRQQEQILSELSSQLETSLRQSQQQLGQLNLVVEENEYTNLIQQSSQFQERIQTLTGRIKQLDKAHQGHQNDMKKLEAQRIEKEKVIQLNEIAMAEHIEEDESRRILAQLSAQFPKFMGELSGLVNPIAPQWVTAMKLAFGQKLLCSFVVQDSQTASQVNQVLKSVGVVKDLVILEKARKLDEKQDNETRKALNRLLDEYKKEAGRGKPARNAKAFMAIDVLESEKFLEGVCQYLLRGTIITDSYQLAILIQQANLPGVYQVITQDGVQLQQGMMISNQKVNFMRNFRKSGQQANTHQVKEAIQKASKQLEDIRQQQRQLQQSSVEGQLKELSQQKNQQEEQHTSVMVAIKQKERQLKSLREQSQVLEQKTQDLKSEFESKKDQLKHIRERIQEIKNKLNQTDFFKEFAKKSGLNPKEIMLLQDQDMVLQKRDALEGTLNKLLIMKQQQEQTEKNLKKKLAEVEMDVHQIKEYDLRDQIEKSNQLIKSLKEELDQLIEKDNQITKEIKQEQKHYKQLVEQRDHAMKKLVDTVQSVNTHKNKISLLQSDKQRLIEECEINSIEIEFKLQDEASETPSIEYSKINNLLRTDDPDDLIEQLNKKIQTKEADATKYLSENLQSGLLGGKGAKRFEETEKDMKEISEKLSVLYEEEQSIVTDLKHCKMLRTERFMNLFKNVSEEIDSLYKALTFQETTQLGGSAMLYLENQAEPFNGGIIYTTTPPNKRYVFDIGEQLSGGEKAIASVALQFAINCALGAPFLLLDEIDANLDPDNTMRLRVVMQALASKPMQFIVISHNPEMFSKAKSLIGVTIQYRRTTSEAFSMLLEQ